MPAAIRLDITVVNERLRSLDSRSATNSLITLSIEGTEPSEVSRSESSADTYGEQTIRIFPPRATNSA